MCVPTTHVRASPVGAWLPAKGGSGGGCSGHEVGAVVAVSRWHRGDIACVRARRGGGGDDIAADRFR